MSRLGSQLTDSGAEPQSESKNTQRLSDLLSENRKSISDIDRDEVQSESYGNETMSEAVDRDWGEPQAVVGGAYSSGYNISVETLTSGFILRVGCQSIAVESGDDVGKLIGLHLSNKSIGDKWMSSEKIVQKFLQENLQVK